ncbi:hypothetical protein RND59_05530 [Vibrio ruber]|uniref:hypothetical protein n=1 Tax=Vibrio ruber TaxID=184755 RepID=UPI002893582F|nr:hypothetical protein [Vibrio ruber]WNJ96557.1 hypothetical protein RND59_05530 [Vibrio ruber]
MKQKLLLLILSIPFITYAGSFPTKEESKNSLMKLNSSYTFEKNDDDSGYVAKPSKTSIVTILDNQVSGIFGIGGKTELDVLMSMATASTECQNIVSSVLGRNDDEELKDKIRAIILKTPKVVGTTLSEKVYGFRFSTTMIDLNKVAMLTCSIEA